MLTGTITIALIVVINRIIEIRKNKGVTDLATEVYEGGSHFIASMILFGVFNGILTILS